MLMVDLRLSLGEQVHPASGSVPPGFTQRAFCWRMIDWAQPPTRLEGQMMRLCTAAERLI
jgi:hypothetical protein